MVNLSVSKMFEIIGGVNGFLTENGQADDQL